jgi:hypothetical protein
LFENATYSEHVKKGKVLHCQSREFVSSVCRFMKREVSIGNPISLEAIQKRVAEVTGVSEGSVRRIMNEHRSAESGTSASFSTPHK